MPKVFNIGLTTVFSINVMGIIACAENMPSGSAQRPGDVVKAANGKTIEVISTVIAITAALPLLMPLSVL